MPASHNRQTGKLQYQDDWHVSTDIHLYLQAFAIAMDRATSPEKRAACVTLMNAVAPTHHPGNRRSQQRGNGALGDLIREAIDERLHGTDAG